MKKLITLFIAAITLFSVSSYAQMGNYKEMKKVLKDSLNLTSVQTDSVVAIQEEFQPKIKEIRMNQSLDKQTKKSQIMALRGQIKTRLKGVLTDEQITKLQAIEERMKEQKRQRTDTTNQQ